ncbi:coat protein [Bacillus subtilis]|nr:coat protein [Bacillus subtilis]
MLPVSRLNSQEKKIKNTLDLQECPLYTIIFFIYNRLFPSGPYGGDGGHNDHHDGGDDYPFQHGDDGDEDYLFHHDDGDNSGNGHHFHGACSDNLQFPESLHSRRLGNRRILRILRTFHIPDSRRHLHVCRDLGSLHTCQSPGGLHTCHNPGGQYQSPDNDQNQVRHTYVLYQSYSLSPSHRLQSRV